MFTVSGGEAFTIARRVLAWSREVARSRRIEPREVVVIERHGISRRDDVPLDVEARERLHARVRQFESRVVRRDQFRFFADAEKLAQPFRSLIHPTSHEHSPLGLTGSTR